MTRLFPVVFALSLLALAGCHVSAGLVVGCDELATEERDPGAFDSLESASFLGVDVLLGDDNGVQVTCDENVLPYVETFVQGTTLVIRIQPGVVVQTERECTAEVVAPAWRSITSSGSGYTFSDELLEGLEVLGSTGSGDVAIAGVHTAALSLGSTGSGNLGISDLQADELELATSGSGSAAVLGQAPILELASTGSGDVYARELVCDDVELSNTGSGEMEVHAGASLTATVTGSGDVHVWGQPADRDVQVTGSGEIVYH